IRLLIQSCSHSGGDVHIPRLTQPELAPTRACCQPIDLEIDQMTLAIRDVAPSITSSCNPLVIGELAVESHIAASQTHTLIVDARKIRLTANPSPKSRI